jgi:hypothetical protein
LEPVSIFLVIIIIFLVRHLLGRFWQWSLEGLANEHTLEHRVVAFWMDRAVLVVQDLVKLILKLSCLFATRAAVDSPDDIITLPVVVIIASWEATAFLFFLVRPSLHHVS